MCLFVPKSEAVRLGIGFFEPFELDPGAEVLFIFSGAFTGMNDIIKNRVGAPGERSADSNDSTLESSGIDAGTKSMGFLADDPANQKVNTEEQQSRLVVFVDSS